MLLVSLMGGCGCLGIYACFRTCLLVCGGVCLVFVVVVLVVWMNGTASIRCFVFI